jgi:hypothetical protein
MLMPTKRELTHVINNIERSLKRPPRCDSELLGKDELKRSKKSITMDRMERRTRRRKGHEVDGGWR